MKSSSSSIKLVPSSPFLLCVIFVMVQLQYGTSTPFSRGRSMGESSLLIHHQQQQLQQPKHSFKHLPTTSNILTLRGGSSFDEEDGTVTDDVVLDLDNTVETQKEEIIDQQPEAVTTTSPPATTVAAATKTAPSSLLMNPKVQNAIERTGPAVLMLFFFYLLVKITGEKGLLYFLMPLMQFGMYKETTGIIEEHYNVQIDANGRGNNFDLEINIEKWWWFVTAFVSTTGRSLLNGLATVPLSLSFLKDQNVVNLICFGMAAIGLVMSVVGMASHADANPDRFRSYLGEVASFHFALIFLVGQSSFWIKTIQSFGIAWLLYPALLVVVNDTMAYVFGVLLGNNKLLPRLSPKKTVEGFIGAAISTVGISIPLLKFFVSYIGKKSDGDLSVCYEKFSSVLSNRNGGNSLVKHAVVMALYTSIISPFGGFLASAVKRAHGAKDFGSLIPGHGGVVDRFDCQVVTAPFVFLYLKSCLVDNGVAADVIENIME